MSSGPRTVYEIGKRERELMSYLEIIKAHSLIYVLICEQFTINMFTPIGLLKLAKTVQIWKILYTKCNTQRSLAPPNLKAAPSTLQ